MRHYPSHLLGGRQQRVALSRAIVGKPRIPRADEPTGNLDSKNGNAVMDLMLRLHAEGATICMVSPDPRYAHMVDRSIDPFGVRVVDEYLVQKHALGEAALDMD